ncbi:hypothetical protein KA529_04885 [Candidatus Saccharibacteria bacterium]|nr:hypothetical protein [Candidatus Saccharibacteria bacterium]
MNNGINVPSAVEMEIFWVLFSAGGFFLMAFIPAFIIILIIVAIRSKGKNQGDGVKPIASKSPLIMGALLPINIVVVLAIIAVRYQELGTNNTNSLIKTASLSVIAITLVGAFVAFLLALTERRQGRSV